MREKNCAVTEGRRAVRLVRREVDFIFNESRVVMETGDMKK